MIDYGRDYDDADESDESAISATGGGKQAAAAVLVEMAIERYDIGMSVDGEPFAVPKEGAPVTMLLRSGQRGLRQELAREYFKDNRSVPSQQALADALLVIEGLAGETVPEALVQRVGQDASGWWIDLGDATGEAIHVTASGWTVTLPPMKFRRTKLTAALPVPVVGGTLDELWEMLNVSEADRPLVLAWLVAAMIPDIPHPILDLAGEQGTGKSSAAKILVSLIDPSPVPLRKPPRDAESWVTAAAGSKVVAIDNMSVIPEWLSDSLCRAVSGEGDVRRALYTDGELAVFAFRRCLILNGIDLGAMRGDLADRLLAIELVVIDPDLRLLDSELTEQWRQAHPRVLGALLDLAARVASVLPTVRLARSPRMADFARVLAAVDQVLGTQGLTRYTDRARNQAVETLTADPFVSAMSWQLNEDEGFIGSSAELLNKIVKPAGFLPKLWPADARQLTTLIKRQAPNMRKAGWRVEEMPPGHDNVLLWTIRPPEKDRVSHSQPSQPRPSTPNASPASVASVKHGASHDDEAGRCELCDAPLDQPDDAICDPCRIVVPDVPAAKEFDERDTDNTQTAIGNTALDTRAEVDGEPQRELPISITHNSRRNRD